MKIAKRLSLLLAVLLTASLMLFCAVPALAAETDDAAAEKTVITAEAAEEAVATGAESASSESATGTKALSAAITVAVVASVGAAGMAVAIAKSAGAMARQPEAAGRINSAMMLGLVFIETAIIYALIVAILIIFVL